MTLPDESRDQIGKSQEIWDWLVHSGFMAERKDIIMQKSLKETEYMQCLLYYCLIIRMFS